MANKNNTGISQYGAFEYRIGSNTATVKHYNIRNATLAKREKVASELKKTRHTKDSIRWKIFHCTKVSSFEQCS